VARDAKAVSHWRMGNRREEWMLATVGEKDEGKVANRMYVGNSVAEGEVMSNLSVEKAAIETAELQLLTLVHPDHRESDM